MAQPAERLHRFLAFGLGLFIISHQAMHLTALTGFETHLIVLSAIQGVYRNPLVEPVLILAILSQIIIGVRLLIRRWRQSGKSAWGWIQICSGAYLGFFLLVHSGAALSTRYIAGVETNFFWAAGTLSSAPLVWFFTPYYFLGVLSVFAHLAAALHFGWAGLSHWIPRAIVAAGTIIALLILLCFGGWLYDIPFPQEYLDLFDSYIR